MFLAMHIMVYMYTKFVSLDLIMGKWGNLFPNSSSLSSKSQSSCHLVLLCVNPLVTIYIHLYKLCLTNLVRT